MEGVLTISIPGEPVAQGRPRFSTRNNMVRTYDPQSSRDYKSLMRLEAARVMRELHLKPTDKPISVSVTVVRRPPSSWSKRRVGALEEGRLEPISVKPDLDNYIKTLDGLNGIVWVDDNQIWELDARKVYGMEPCMVIEVSEFKEA